MRNRRRSDGGETHAEHGNGSNRLPGPIGLPQPARIPIRLPNRKRLASPNKLNQGSATQKKEPLYPVAEPDSRIFCRVSTHSHLIIAFIHVKWNEIEISFD